MSHNPPLLVLAEWDLTSRPRCGDISLAVTSVHLVGVEAPWKVVLNVSAPVLEVLIGRRRARAQPEWFMFWWQREMHFFFPSSFKVSIEGAWFLVSLSCLAMLHVVVRSRSDLGISGLYMWLPSRLQQLIVLYFCPKFSVFYLNLHFEPVIKSSAPDIPGWSLHGVKACWLGTAWWRVFFFSEVSYPLPPSVFSFPPPCRGKCELCLSQPVDWRWGVTEL